MGISSAFVNSSSGLSAAAKWSELTATNIANANNPEYVKRGLTTESAASGGVLITGVHREIDSNLIRMYRLELAGMARQETIANELNNYSYQLGNPDDTFTISGQLSGLYSGFGLLSNSPADVSLQNNALKSAQGLASSLNTASNSLAQTLSSVTKGIESDVRTVNGSLEKIASLNNQIVQEGGPTGRRAILQDERASEIDALAQLMNINVSQDNNGNMNISTRGGTQLVDGISIFEVEYDSAGGSLNVGNAEITPGKNGARGFSEGQLAGRFELKDKVLPQMQLQLDEFARALIQGFEAVDASLVAGQAGLFTDLGASYDPLQLNGLAGRISVNAVVDPAQGGEIWRIRDGIGATVPGSASDSTQAISFLTVFETAQNFDSAAGQGDTAELMGYVSGMVADQKLVQVHAQEKQGQLGGRVAAVLSARQSAQGVNLDEELQRLTQIEQSYAANARVMQSLTAMIDTLLASV